MKCLSVCQPWAHMILYGGKTVENRKWPTAYRGPLLIHAGKSKSWLEGMTFEQWQEEYSLSVPGSLIFGAILGKVRLLDCVRIEKLARSDYLAWAEGPWCWILGAPEPFTRPVYYRGERGLFDVDESVLVADGGNDDGEPTLF